MTKHLQEYEIDTLTMTPERLTDEDRRRFEAHVKRCALCQEHARLARDFYSNFKEGLARGESPADAVVADRAARRPSQFQLPQFGVRRAGEVPAGLIEYSEMKPSVLARAVQLVRLYPVRSTAGVGVVAAAIMLAVSFVRTPTRPVPAYAKIQDDLLTVYNSEGLPLWKKNARGLPDWSTVTGFAGSKRSEINYGLVLIDDVHERPGPEVLLHGHPNDRLSPSDFSPEKMYCFDSRGDLIWSQSYPLEEFSSFREQKGGDWNIAGMFMVNGSLKNPNVRQHRLFIFMHNKPFSPSALVEVNGSTGARLQTYTHFGYITYAYAASVAGDARQKIFLSGMNNAYNKPFLAVLDPDSVSGVGPTPAEFRRELGGTGLPGTEMYYLLFPRTQMASSLSLRLYNNVQTVQHSPDGSFIVTVDEFNDDTPSNTRGTILYSFDKEMRVKSVTFSDQLQRTYQLLWQQGKRFVPLDEQYAEKLKKEVQYWDGEKFGEEPTINKFYSAGKKLP